MRRMPYSPRVETWKAAWGAIPSISLGIVGAPGAKRHGSGWDRQMPLRYGRAAVGSTNPAKLEAVHRALARLAPGCSVEGLIVSSRVRAQPIGDDETRSGAMAR